MALTYTAALKAERMTAMRTLLANGTLEILTPEDTVVATFGLSEAGGTVTGGTWTLEFDAASVPATATGTAAKAQIRDALGTPQVTGLTVGQGSGDISLDNTAIATGQTVTLSLAVITHS